MLQWSTVAYFVRTLLEGLVIIFSIFLMSDKKIEYKKLLLSGFLVGISTFLVRLLPIHFGVHTIILLLIIIFITVRFCKIDFYKAVTSGIVFIIILFICEWLVSLIYIKLLKFSPEVMTSESVISVLLSVPPLILAMMIAIFISYLKTLRKRNK